MWGNPLVFINAFEHPAEFLRELDEPLLIVGRGRGGIEAQPLVKRDGLMETAVVGEDRPQALQPAGEGHAGRALAQMPAGADFELMQRRAHQRSFISRHS
jgi:hypothetical protein